MKNSKNITTSLLRLSEAAEKLGTTTQTLRNWTNSGRLKSVRTEGNQRRIPLSEIERLQGSPKRTKILVYARVSTQKQKDNLDRQVGRLLEHVITISKDFELYKDIGSGLNDNRKSFKKLLNRISDPDVLGILIEYKDRISRYGFSTLETYCNNFGVFVNVMNQMDSQDFEQEFSKDIVSLIASYSARLYGRRGGRAKKNESFS